MEIINDKDLLVLLFYNSHFTKALLLPKEFDFKPKEKKNKYEFRNISVKSKIAVNELSLNEGDVYLSGEYRTLEHKGECVYDNFMLFDDVEVLSSTRGAFESRIHQNDKELVFETEFDGFKKSVGYNLDDSSIYDPMLDSDKSINNMLSYVEGHVIDYFRFNNNKCYHTSNISDQVDILDMRKLMKKNYKKTIEEIYFKEDVSKLVRNKRKNKKKRKI